MQDFSNLVEEVENTLIPYFRKIEKRALFNQEKVLNAFTMLKLAKVIYRGLRVMDMMILGETI